jgi:hypothetical protein
MTGPEGKETVPAEVSAWAEGVLERKPKQPPLQEVPTDVKGLSIRVVRGTDISALSAEETDRFDRLTREATWIDQVYKERRPLVRQRAIDFAKDEHPGVMGTVRDPDHGNFRVTVVPQTQVIFDDPAIKASLGEKAARVYKPITEVKLTYGGELETADGTKLSPERVRQIIKHALLGAGVWEKLLDEGLIKRLAEERDNLELAKIIREEGMPAEGISFGEPTWRLEIDDVDKHRAIKVRRPRLRKNLITPRAG